jgi:hypothetical protein
VRSRSCLLEKRDLQHRVVTFVPGLLELFQAVRPELMKVCSFELHRIRTLSDPTMSVESGKRPDQNIKMPLMR